MVRRSENLSGDPTPFENIFEEWIGPSVRLFRDGCVALEKSVALHVKALLANFAADVSRIYGDGHEILTKRGRVIYNETGEDDRSSRKSDSITTIPLI